MYVCGPTVYDSIHVGNARAAVVFDVLHRILRNLYDKVIYVRNITDVDDKIYAAASGRNISIEELTQKTIADYHDDLEALNVLPVTHEPRVTNHIVEIIEFVTKLICTRHAYVSEGHVFFDVASCKNYGILSNKNMDDLMAGARVEISDLKKNPLDFVLWKPSDEKFPIGWESPWSFGRPGWHIECSALALQYLGEQFDIHGGGADLVFPHHENEVVQTCAYSGRKAMANYWIHNGHLTICGDKMSKSLGNCITVCEIRKKYTGEVIRLALLMTHYAAPMNFDFALLDQAKNILDRWYTALRDVATIPWTDETDSAIIDALLDDMNTPKAISIASAMVDRINKALDKQRLAAVFVNTCRKFLGIMTIDVTQWFCDVTFEKKAWIESKVMERTLAKMKKDFSTADAIRNELSKEGITIEDTSHGTIWKTSY
jgi:cysteinyl-tRNA synthetase